MGEAADQSLQEKSQSTQYKVNPNAEVKETGRAGWMK